MQNQEKADAKSPEVEAQASVFCEPLLRHLATVAQPAHGPAEDDRLRDRWTYHGVHMARTPTRRLHAMV